MFSKRPTLLTAAGTSDHRAVMRRAWQLMTIRYGLGRIPFASIGRKCFAGCLRQAWSEAREEIARNAIPAELRAERIAHLQAELSSLVYLDDWRHANRREIEIRAALDRLAA